MSKSITKVSAVMLAIMTLLSSIFVVQADAATGDKVTIAFYYCFDSVGNTIRYQQTTSNNGYTVGSAGEELCRITANGEEAYCIEPGHSLFAGDQLTEGSSSVWNSLGAAKQNAINLALLCGKPGSENTLPGSADEKWAATQLIVWEIVSDCRLAYGNYQCTNTKYIDGLTAGGANSGVKSAYDRIVSNMQTIQRIPSFASDSASNAKTYEMNAVNGGYSLSLYDGNSVLDKFNFSSAGGVTVSRSGNTLTLTAKNPINSAVTLSATRVISGVNTSLIVYGDSGLQDVVTGTSGITVSAYLKVTAKSGSLKLVKTSEDGIVADIEFTITGKNYNRTAKSDKNGEIILADLIPGTYTVTEKVDPRYETQEPKTVVVKADETTTVEFKNTLRKGDLKIIKTSEDGIVADIEFTIKGKNYNRTVKSDKNGEIILADLVPGTYTVTEKVDSRYEAQAPKNVKVEADKTATVSFKNTLRKGDLKIIKTSEDGNVADIEFTITGKNYSRTAKSDKNGEIVLADLIPGTYTVTEKVDPRYETQEQKTVVVKADETATVEFKNTLKKWVLHILKKDSETGNVIPYAGTAFQIYAPDGTLVSMNGVDTFTTNNEGRIITPEPLPYGKGYSIAEVKAPDGYVLDDAPAFFDVIDETTTEENGVMVIMIEKSDPPQKGRITVEKIGEVFTNVISAENEEYKTYQPVYSVAGLSGAVFKVYADEDITTADGTVRVKKDTLAATLKTDENGKATSKQLYLGRYRIVEVKAPYGTVLNREPKAVELTYAGQNKKITTVAAEFNNDRQKVKIDLLKVMGIDERFALGINNEVLNVTFGLFADEDITAENGNMIPKDGLIEVVSCDENGVADFSTDLPFGSYYVQELTTDEHYILSDTKYPVVFEYAGQDIDTVHIKVNDGEPIINEPKYGTVKGLKIDREIEEPIEGAVFGLFKNDETVFTEDTAILTAISDENGIFSFENVPYGSYAVHEIKPADGYIPNESNYPITISEHEEVVEITAVNDRFPEIRTTAMIEGKKEVGATDVFALEDTVEYKHLIPCKEYVLKGILMDKSANVPFLSDGKEVTSEVVFTPEQANGTVMVQFVFDATLIAEETDIVAFETLYADGAELAVHADIEDDDQTVTVKIPEIRTHAEADSKKEVTAEEKITIIDTVSYKNLTVGKEYAVKGVLMDKMTGKPFMVDDKEITAEVTFTPETADGNIEVVFVFDGLTVKMDTDVVVFETLYHNDIELTAHADIEDTDQTVRVSIPKIRTQASIDGKKEVTTNKPVTITDIVSFENLTVGKEYKLVGVLMDKTTGKPMTVNGNEITAEVVFTAEKENGEIEVSFTFGGVLITKDIELVVFETLYRGDNEIAVHADINDTDQTVIIRPVLVPPPDVPKTGDNTPVSLWIGLGAVALGAVIAFLFVKFRKKDEDDDE